MSAGSADPHGASVPSSTDLMSLPDVVLDALTLRDVEASLLGLLPDGHLLGAAVGDGPSGHRVRWGGPEFTEHEGSGLLLRDDELTPVAALVSMSSGEDGVALADLVAVRRRESGIRADLALAPADLAPTDLAPTDPAPTDPAPADLAPADLAPADPAPTDPAPTDRPKTSTGTRGLLLADRPPLLADRADLEELRASVDELWVIVADTPTPALPLATLIAATEAWVLGGDLTEPPATPTADAGPHTTHLRTAPLAWRDPASDALLRDRLAIALGAAQVMHLATDDQSPGARAWGDLVVALDRGQGSPLDEASAAVSGPLLTWRPPRTNRGLVIMFTGLSGSGKSTVARDLSDWVRDRTPRRSTLLDGDLVRQMLSAGLGFDRESRIANVRRIGYVASEIARHGGIAICSPIAPYAETRAEVRAMAESAGDFFLIHVNTPIEECERRDLKGLYAKARAGLLSEFTGISDPYDVPLDADLRVDTSVLDREAALGAVLDALETGGWLTRVG